MSSQADYLAARGLRETKPEALNQALQVVLASMDPMVYDDPGQGLTPEEQAVLRRGGLTLEPQPGPDPVADTVVQFAAITKRSLSPKQVSEQLGMAGSRVRQMIADRSIYSFLVDNSRYVPDFQFAEGRLVPNITKVNKTLNPRKHPVAVYSWYHLPNADLFLNDDIDDIISPLDWLKGGHALEQVLLAAQHL